MSDDILQAIAQLSIQVGEVRGIVTGIDSKLSSHIVDDRSVELRVRGLEDTRSSQRGASRAWALIGTSAGAIVGGIGTFLKLRGHH